MAASCGRQEVHAEEYERVGLDERHAYSELDVRQIGSQRYVPYIIYNNLQYKSLCIILYIYIYIIIDVMIIFNILIDVYIINILCILHVPIVSILCV